MTRAAAPAQCATTPIGASIGDWWTSFFDDTYVALGLVPRQGTEAEHAADGIVKLLELAPGATVFDQCCGIGRIALPLARRGMRVRGVELMQAYVDAATRAAEAEKLDASFTCGDGYLFAAKPACDVAVNVFTSFGYSDDDERNLEMLRRAFDSVKPGGRLLLERVNPCWVVAYGLGTYANRVPDGNGGETLVIDEPRADWVRGVIRSTWTIAHPDGRRESRTFETRMLFPNELASLAKRAGFEDIALFGGLDGCPYDRYSKRLVLTARRPQA